MVFAIVSYLVLLCEIYRESKLASILGEKLGKNSLRLPNVFVNVLHRLLSWQ